LGGFAGVGLYHLINIENEKQFQKTHRSISYSLGRISTFQEQFEDDNSKRLENIR